MRWPRPHPPLPASGWEENRAEKGKYFYLKLSEIEKTKQRRAEQQPEFNFTLKLVSPAGRPGTWAWVWMEPNSELIFLKQIRFNILEFLYIYFWQTSKIESFEYVCLREGSVWSDTENIINK